MTVKRGEIWLADLNPIKGSEQAGIRPVLIFQNDTISRFTTNLRRASLSSCVRLLKDEGGLTNDSVALCHQLRALDQMRLRRKLGTVSQDTLSTIENCVLSTMGVV